MKTVKQVWDLLQPSQRRSAAVLLCLMLVGMVLETLGIGAELSAVIVEERFAYLDAPVMRVTYPDTHCPFSQLLEQFNLPNADTIAEALRRLAAY